MKRITISVILVMSVLLVFSSYAFADSEYEIGLTEDAVVIGDWFLNEYVDEFGDPIGKLYCASICEGEFSNSATTGSNLAVAVYYEPRTDIISFRLLEYGDRKATYTNSSEKTLKYKVDKKTIENSLIGVAPNADLYLSTDDSAKFIKYMKDGTKVKAIIYLDNSKYQFEVSGNGFDSICAKADELHESIGIAGVYYDIYEKPNDDYYEVIPSSPTTGVLTYHTDSEYFSERYGANELQFDYNYDLETHVMTWEDEKMALASWNNTTSLLFADDYCVILSRYGYFDGTIPDTPEFDATVTWVDNRPESKLEETYSFHKDCSWDRKWISYYGEEQEPRVGAYYRDGNILYMIHVIDSYSGPTSFVIPCFVYDGHFLSDNIHRIYRR